MIKSKSSNTRHSQDVQHAIEAFYGFKKEHTAFYGLGEMATLYGRLFIILTLRNTASFCFRISDSMRLGFRKFLTMFMIDTVLEISLTSTPRW